MQGEDRLGGLPESNPSGDAVLWSQRDPALVWAQLDAGLLTARERLGRLARTIESDVIPRLVSAHQPIAAPARTVVASYMPSLDDVETFVERLVDGDEPRLIAVIESLRQRGMSVETMYLDLLAPAARRLGDLWCEDTCDFPTVTVGCGRLQRLLRQWSPLFGTEVRHTLNGRRALLLQAPGEQHSFGLSMVAEFFRRAGWEVCGGVGGSEPEPARRVRNEWFDVIGSDLQLDWLRRAIGDVRIASRNPAMAVMVGGPVISRQPQLVAQVGADGSAGDARDAPVIAERLLAQLARESG
jgi:MerR family transcriptional regulator, light-induced transcriptional regulator